MTKLFRRFIAYTIDLLVITIIVQSLSGIPQINRQLDDYNKYYDKYVIVLESYSNFKVDLVDDFENKKISEKEYNALIEKHSDYEEILTKYYSDKEISEKEYKKINKKIDKEYQEKYKKLYYKMEKNSLIHFVIYIITIFAYFVGFNKLTNGQTLGKKLTRLKIKNIKEDKEQVPVWSYLIRTLILYQPLYYLVKLIGINFLSIDKYYTVTSIFYNIQYYIELVTIVTIALRFDGRGIHDLLAKTKVIQLDKEGNEIKENIPVIVKKVKTTKNNKKIIDEPSE